MIADYIKAAKAVMKDTERFYDDKYTADKVWQETHHLLWENFVYATQLENEHLAYLILIVGYSKEDE